MHHVLKAWCIFYWFHFDSQGRWGQKGQNAECSPRSLLSAAPEAFCRQIISGMFLVNVQKQRTTHACVCFYFVVRYLAPAPFPSSDSCPASFSFCRILYAWGVSHVEAPPHLREKLPPSSAPVVLPVPDAGAHLYLDFAHIQRYCLFLWSTSSS